MDEDQDESVLQNKDPEIVGLVLSSAIGFIQLYGWFIVFAVIILLYLRSKVQPWLGSYLDQREVSSYKKLDSGLAQARLEAMERARMKMQTQLDENAKLYAKRQKEKEEEKRIQRLENLENPGKSSRNKSKANTSHLEAPAVVGRVTGRHAEDHAVVEGEVNPAVLH